MNTVFALSQVLNQTGVRSQQASEAPDLSLIIVKTSCDAVRENTSTCKEDAARA